MIKIYFTFLFAVFYCLSFSQSLDVEIDKFTKQKRITYDKTYYRLFNLAKLENPCWLSLRSVDTSIFIKFIGTLDAGVVGEDDPVILLFEDDTTTKLYPTHTQSYEVNVTSYGTSKHYEHQYRLSNEQLSLLCNKKLESVRRYYNDVYVDEDVSKKTKIMLINYFRTFALEFRKK